MTSGNFNPSINGVLANWSYAGGCGVTTKNGPIAYPQVSPEGDQAAYLQGDGSLVRQTLLWTSGNAYKINYYTIKRSGFNRNDLYVYYTQNSSLYEEASPITTHASDPNAGYVQLDFVTYTLYVEGADWMRRNSTSFTPTASEGRVAFKSGPGEGGDMCAIIDGVTIIDA